MKWIYTLLVVLVGVVSAHAQATVKTVNTISNLVATAPSTTGIVRALGYWEPNDGGGGDFLWDKVSVAETNTGTIFSSSVVVDGRWFRQFEPMVIKARWFGVRGPFLDHALINVDQGPDESPYIDSAMKYASNHLNVTVEFGPGDYMLTRTVFVPMATFVKGENPVTWFDNAGGRSSPVTGYMMNHNHTSTRFYPSQAMVGPMFAFTTTNSPLSVTPIRPTPIYLNPFPPTLGDGSEYLIYGFGSGLLNCQLDGSIITKSITTNRAVDGIFVDRAASILIDNVDVFHVKGWAIWSEGTWDLQIRNSRFTSHPDSYGCSLFKRMQDGKITDSYFAGQVNWFEDCGENLYQQNTFFNNWEKVERMSHWSNVVSVAGSPVFFYPGHNLRTPWPVIFTNAAPAGFDTNHTYWVSVVDESNFKLCPLPGYVGQVDTNSFLTGARNGIGITNTESGTWTLNGSPDCLVYNRSCIQGIWDANRIDQSVNHAVILSGPRCFENSFIGDSHLNMGLVFTGGAHITTTIPWYAAFVVKDGSARNTMIPAQVGADLFGFAPLTVNHSIGWVINDGCDYNVLGGGSRGNLSTNYLLGAVGTEHTEIQFEQGLSGAQPPIRQSLQRGLLMRYSQTSPQRLVGDLSGVVIGTNDFTIAAHVTVPAAGIYSGIIALSPVSTSESGPGSFAIQARGDNLWSIYLRDGAGSSVNGAANYYDLEPELRGTDVWIAASRSYTNVIFTVNGLELAPKVATHQELFNGSIGGGTNYCIVGLASTILALGGRVNDVMVFNFAMTADEMVALKTVPRPVAYKDGWKYTNQLSGLLTHGQKYRIVNYVAPDNFSNVGATANVSGAEFIATNRTPTVWASGSSLLHLGLLAWPNIERGYGTTMPERTFNGWTWTTYNGVAHQIDEPDPADSVVLTQIPDINQPVQTGVKFERSSTSFLRTDLTSFPIGTNDFTIAVNATVTTNAVGTGFIAISQTSTGEDGAYSFFVGLRPDRIWEMTRRSSTGASTGGDSSSKYYVATENIAGRNVWVVVTRSGTNAVLYVNGQLRVPYVVTNEGGMGGAMANGLANYVHWGIYSLGQSMDGAIRDAFIDNHAWTAAEVASLNANAIPSRYLYGRYAFQISGLLEAGQAYQLVDFQAGDNFSNLGSDNTVGNIFVASARTPTTWTHASSIKRLGVTVWPNVGIGNGSSFTDRGPLGFSTVAVGTGVHHLIPVTAAVGSGTVTAVSIANANGFSGTSSGGSTPALTIIAGAITPTSVNSVVLSGVGSPAIAVTGSSSISGNNTGDQTITLTGDVTGSGASSFAATIANDVVSNAKLSNMATARFKGRTTAGTGDPEDLTPTQATALLDTMVGDAGGGGTKGLVTAPAAGDAAAGKFLHANGTWTVPAGGGDVVGPGSSTDNAAVRFDGTTGKILQNSAVIIADTTGDITGGKYNKLTITPPTTSATLTIADGKTFTTTFTGTFGGTDGTTHNFPLTSSTVARTDAAQTFTGLQTFNTGVRVASAQQIDFNADTILTRKGAANFQFGAADSGTPVAQTVSFQGASGSNVPGVNTIFNGSRGTGSGSGGDLQFQIAPVGAVGATVQNTLVPGLRIYDAGTTIVRVDAATSGQIGFTSRSRISSASNGTIKFTSNTGGPMTLATFGETTGGATDFTLTANSTSGTDQSAGNFIVQAPLATGTGRSGSVIVKTGAYTTGTTHTTGDRDFIYAGKTALTTGTTNTLFTVDFLTSSAWDDCFGMEVFGTEIASNGGSWAQVRSFKSLIDVIPGALDGIPPPESNYSTSISTTLSAGADNTSGGTTPVPSARRVGSQIFVEVISDATAAGGPHFCKWRVQINGGFGILVTPFN